MCPSVFGNNTQRKWAATLHEVNGSIDTGSVAPDDQRVDSGPLVAWLVVMLTFVVLVTGVIWLLTRGPR
jgi:hypothetical protein